MAGGWKATEDAAAERGLEGGGKDCKASRTHARIHCPGRSLWKKFVLPIQALFPFPDIQQMSFIILENKWNNTKYDVNKGCSFASSICVSVKQPQ